MGEITLSIKHGDVESMETAIQTAHDALNETSTSILDELKPILEEWSQTTGSRQAQMDFEADLRTGAEALSKALLEVKKALAEAREKAHNAEVRAVVCVE